MAATSPHIHLRPPSHTPSPPSANPTLQATTHTPPPSFPRGTTFVPSPPFLEGVWHVTHSSLPMWKKAQNVSITYTILSSDSSGRPTFDNLVSYQSLGAAEDAGMKTVKGVEAPRGDVEGAWRWRGKGWLMIASSDWEILGFGRSPSSSSSSVASKVNSDLAAAKNVAREKGEERRGDDWVVTYFAKTLFTPSGVDIYCRSREGVAEEVYKGIVEGLGGCGKEVKKLAGELFEVKRTGV